MISTGTIQILTRFWSLRRTELRDQRKGRFRWLTSFVGRAAIFRGFALTDCLFHNGGRGLLLTALAACREEASIPATARCLGAWVTGPCIGWELALSLQWPRCSTSTPAFSSCFHSISTSEKDWCLEVKPRRTSPRICLLQGKGAFRAKVQLRSPSSRIFS